MTGLFGCFCKKAAAGRPFFGTGFPENYGGKVKNSRKGLAKPRQIGYTIKVNGEQVGKMSVPYPEKDTYTMEDLLAIMRILRSPEGCPWDRVQTHESIRTNLLEETHEALEALDTGDRAGLCEELGDILMQVVFHAQIDAAEGGFTFDDVTDTLCRKLIVRHPHVFGDGKADDAAEVLRNWDAIKRKTKGDKPQSELLRSVPRSLPALMRAEKVQGRAKRVGFDWRDASGAWTALDSELEEWRKAVRDGDPAAVEDELGDVLFSVVNVSRFVGAEAERALTHATDKFVRRFTEAERIAAERGETLSDSSEEELDSLWQEAKRRLREESSGIRRETADR